MFAGQIMSKQPLSEGLFTCFVAHQQLVLRASTRASAAVPQHNSDACSAVRKRALTHPISGTGVSRPPDGCRSMDDFVVVLCEGTCGMGYDGTLHVRGSARHEHNARDLMRGMSGMGAWSFGRPSSI